MAGVKAPLSPWTDALLEPMRQVGDPLADQVITELFQDGDIGAVNSLMRNLIANEYPAPEGLPPIVRDYLAATSELPPWANVEQLVAGERVFWRFGPKLALILHCYSLPFCYLGQNGVNVLALTTRLMSNPTRRILETAQMLMDVMQPGGLSNADGRGRRTVQKVRLMHAAVRHLAPTSDKWQPSFGLPVNQEDLAGTLMAFSWVGLDGLAKLGIEVSPEDQYAYLHSWLVAGHLLGVRPELLPHNVESAKALVEAIARRQFGPSQAGQDLTHALVEMMRYVLPGNALDFAPALLIRYFLGREYAAWLGVEAEAIPPLVGLPLRLLGGAVSDVLRDSRAIAALAERVGHLLLESLVFVERGGNRPSFTIPTELVQQWGVNWRS